MDHLDVMNTKDHLLIDRKNKDQARIDRFPDEPCVWNP